MPSHLSQLSQPGRARAFRAALLVLAAIATSCDGDPGLVVESLAVPTSVLPGDDFGATSRVCNRGGAPTDPDVIELRLRPLGAAGAGDLLGSRGVPQLDPGQCHSEQTLLTAPSDVDEGPHELQGRLVESGHERASEVFGVGNGPDLYVEELLAPTSATPSQSFAVSARVCNRGTAWTTSSSLTLYLSDDWQLTGPPGLDVPAGALDVPSLPPGGCLTLEGTATADVPGDAPYLLGAIVDEADLQPELVESNNARLLHLIGVGWLPDLVVRSISAPSSTGNGASFEVEALVCNEGTTSSVDTDVSFFLSEDAAIQPPVPPDPASGDVWLGALSLPSLPPGFCFPVAGAVDAAAPHDGEWFVGALVDEGLAVDELIEPNNDRAGPLIGVGSGADLVVQAIEAPPNAEPGLAFDVAVELCNRGTLPSGPSRVRLFLSMDESLETEPPPSDPEIGVVAFASLPPGACLDATAPVLADSAISGAVRLFALADGFEEVAELVESNNPTLGSWLGVGVAPDLVVRSLTAPASVHAGESFDVGVELCNQGTAPSPPTQVSLYHSTDALIEGLPGPLPPQDLYVGAIALGDALVPGACRSISGSVMADGSAAGAYILGAIADEPALVDELQEANNGFAGPVMGVGDGPDLVVTRLEAPPTALAAAPLSLDYEVCNRGTAVAGASLVAFYDSSDAAIEVGPPGPAPDPDRWLGDDAVPALGPGECFAATKVVSLPPGDLGERHLAAVADDGDAVAELVEANDVFLGPILGVGSGPDLVITLLAAPPSVPLSAPLSIDTQVCNQGTQPSGEAALSLYLSDDAEIEGGYFVPVGADSLLAELTLPALEAGACHAETAVAPASPPEEGEWLVGGIADEGLHLAELVESNNTSLGPVVGVGHGSDLVVGSVDLPPSMEIGTSFPVSAQVCNQGTGPSPSASVTLYHSADAEIDSAFPGPPGTDFPFAGLEVGPLQPGECAQPSGTGWATVPDDGAWYAGAFVDEADAVAELVESNNTFVGPVVGVGFAPDLVVESLDVPAGLSIGASFSFDVTVCNQGTDSSAPTLVAFYHSSDDALEVPPAPPPWDTHLDDLDVPGLAPGACHVGTKLLEAGVPGPGYLAASADDGDALVELIEANNDAFHELVIAP